MAFGRFSQLQKSNPRPKMMESILAAFDPSVMHTTASTTSVVGVTCNDGGMTSCGDGSALWEWKGPTAGVYDNAWHDLDTTPHTWTHSEPVDPSAIDSWVPYGPVQAADNTSGIVAGAQIKAAYDGTCNPMPGWNVTWNPSSGGGCTLNPMYNQAGLGYGASYGSGSSALAVPLVAGEVKEVTPALPAKALRPTCGHYLLATEACLLGALTATGTMMEKMLKGEQSAIQNWTNDFQTSSTEMASACTPMGAWVLENHVFKQRASA